MWIWIATPTGKQIRATQVTKLTVDNREDKFFIEYQEKEKAQPCKIMLHDRATIKIGKEKPEVS